MSRAGIYYHGDFSRRGYVILKDRVRPGFESLAEIIDKYRIPVFEPEVTPEIEALLTWVHTMTHITDVQRQGYHEVALLSAAAVVAGAEKLARGELDYCFCFTGTAGHHAGADYSWGFCYYNDVAMAVRRLRLLDCRRIMIIDVDPHFGDGTRSLLGNDPDIIHVNFHTSHAYGIYEDKPGVSNFSGEHYDIELGAAVDVTFLDALDRILSRDWDFQMLIIIFGHDSHQDDYGGFQLSNAAFSQMAKKMRVFAGNRPVLTVLSGGSNPRVAADVIPLFVREFV